MMEQVKLKQVFPEKKWGSIDSLNAVETLNPSGKEELCTIFLDAKGHEPELLKVSDNFLQKKVGFFVDFGKIPDLKATLGTLLIKSDPELMTCLRESQVAKRAGNYRKFDDIVQECNI